MQQQDCGKSSRANREPDKVYKNRAMLNWEMRVVVNFAVVSSVDVHNWVVGVSVCSSTPTATVV